MSTLCVCVQQMARLVIIFHFFILDHQYRCRGHKREFTKPRIFCLCYGSFKSSKVCYHFMLSYCFSPPPPPRKSLKNENHINKRQDSSLCSYIQYVFMAYLQNILYNFCLSIYRPAIVVLLMSMVNEKQPFPLRCAVLYCFQSFLYKNEVGQSQIVTTLLPTSSDGESVCSDNLCIACIHQSANQVFLQMISNNMLFSK